MEEGYEFLVDTREKPNFTKKVEVLISPEGQKWRRTTLETDIVLRKMNCSPVEDIVGIERKAVADLVGSIQSQRIFKQIPRMKKLYKVCYLAISGDMNQYQAQMRFRNMHVNLSPVYGALASFAVKERINVVWFPDDSTLIDVMYRICTKISEGKYDAQRDLSAKWERNKPSVALSYSVPGITEEKAKLLIEKFGSLRAICLATEEELREAGLGEKTANELHEFLGKQA